MTSSGSGFIPISTLGLVACKLCPQRFSCIFNMNSSTIMEAIFKTQEHYLGYEKVYMNSERPLCCEGYMHKSHKNLFVLKKFRDEFLKEARPVIESTWLPTWPYRY
jgi:hypothetical protein